MTHHHPEPVSRTVIVQGRSIVDISKDLQDFGGFVDDGSRQLKQTHPYIGLRQSTVV